MPRPLRRKASPGNSAGADGRSPGHAGVDPSGASLTHVRVRSLRLLGAAFAWLRPASVRVEVTKDDIGEQLTAWGKVATIESRGRTSGRVTTAAVGFVEEPDGSILVAAGQPDADWARNLEADPRCRVTTENRTVEMLATPLDASEAARAVVELILKYGTPAERMGRGPAFRLTPAR